MRPIKRQRADARVVLAKQHRIAGNDELNSLVSIELDDIESVAIEEIDGGKTVLATGAVIVAAPIVLLGLGLGLALSGQ